MAGKRFKLESAGLLHLKKGRRGSGLRWRS